jgi:F-type H+-transporting ATPase subunit a
LEIHVAIQPNVLFTAGPLVITNTLLTAWIAVVVVIVFALLATRNMQLVPTGLQNFAEAIVEGLLNFGQQAAGPSARTFLPLVGTLFLYIWFANWVGILPGVGTIPAFRSPNSDLSITAAMALIVFIWVQVVGLRADPVAYFKKFFWPPGLSLLELIQEFARPLSLALRLFGNILAGYMLVEVMLQMVPIGVPAVFLALELGVGLIQALIFAILTLVFLSFAAAHGGHGDHSESEHAAH